MKTPSSRRRLRIRRKRKDDGARSKLLGPSHRRYPEQGSDDSNSFARDVAEEVVFESGCCLFEAVLTASALFALLSVPMYLLLNRVT